MNTFAIDSAAEDFDMKETDPYLAQFERIEQEAGGQHPTWLYPLRKAGLARFAELGVPTLQDEDWRFTNLAPLTRLPFKPVFVGARKGVNQETLSECLLASLAGDRLVFVDGHYAPELSTLGSHAPGVQVGSLMTTLRQDGTLLEKHLARYTRDEGGAFTALNTAFFTDGAFIHVPAGQVVTQPVHLVFLSRGQEAGATAHARNLIIVERGSQLTVIESYLGLGDAPTLTNSVTEVVLGEGASLEHCKVQDERPQTCHIGALHAHLGRSSNFIAHSLALGARLYRQNIRTTLAAEGVECVLNGLYLTNGDQVADHHMVVDHAQPRCNSHEYFNGILAGRSKGVFHGRILVRKDAQKTDAKQTNKNILLSDEATVDTKPQLEIYADDVKCTHGATIGQLNAESIFYLRSRGIPEEMARRMLIHAFAGEIIERIRCATVREELDRLVWARLEANERVCLTT